jgi:O-antigen ligase
VHHAASGVLTPQQAHNDYLELLASGGVLAAALFVWFVIVLIRQARQSVTATHGFQRAVVLGAIISLSGVAVHSLIDFGLHITINALGFVILLGILSLKSFEDSEPKRSRGGRRSPDGPDVLETTGTGRLQTRRASEQ